MSRHMQIVPSQLDYKSEHANQGYGFGALLTQAQVTIRKFCVQDKWILIHNLGYVQTIRANIYE